MEEGTIEEGSKGDVKGEECQQGGDGQIGLEVEGNSLGGRGR
jgi:hypothetical protein